MKNWELRFDVQRRLPGADWQSCLVNADNVGCSSQAEAEGLMTLLQMADQLIREGLKFHYIIVPIMQHSSVSEEMPGMSDDQEEPESEFGGN